MPKLKTERILIYFKNEGNNEMRQEKPAFDFKLDINVTQDGTFTCTLPEDVVGILDAAQIGKLQTNGRRDGRRGYFEAHSLPELLKIATEPCNQYAQKKLISEKIVILYEISTACRYAINKEGELLPYAAYDHKREKQFASREGTLEMHSQKPRAYGFNMYVSPRIKRVFQYGSGMEKTFYSHVGNNELWDEKYDKAENLKFLCALHNQRPLSHSWDAFDHFDQLDYTEDTAKFFVDMFKAIFLMNERIKDFVKPEAILQIIENKQKLLG